MAGKALVSKNPIHNPQKLGVSGLALHYANIITQIDSIVSTIISSFLYLMLYDSHSW